MLVVVEGHFDQEAEHLMTVGVPLLAVVVTG
jgi:hypothetical protein